MHLEKVLQCFSVAEIDQDSEEDFLLEKAPEGAIWDTY